MYELLECRARRCWRGRSYSDLTLFTVCIQTPRVKLSLGNGASCMVRCSIMGINHSPGHSIGNIKICSVIKSSQVIPRLTP